MMTCENAFSPCNDMKDSACGFHFPVPGPAAGWCSTGPRTMPGLGSLPTRTWPRYRRGLLTTDWATSPFQLGGMPLPQPALARLPSSDCTHPRCPCLPFSQAHDSLQGSREIHIPCPRVMWMSADLASFEPTMYDMHEPFQPGLSSTHK